MKLISRIAIFIITILPTFANGQHTKSAVINGKRYIGHLSKLGFCLLSAKGDTVLNLRENYFFDFHFTDFNHDGYNDIVIELFDNTPNVAGLWLYIPDKRTFKEVSNFPFYPSAESIKGSKYYYSYHRVGCGDETWTSDLFYIKDFKAITIGTINGEGCGDKDGIYIYKVKGERETLIKTLPLNIINKYKAFKWGFIKSYWTKYYRKFIQGNA